MGTSRKGLLSAIAKSVPAVAMNPGLGRQTWLDELLRLATLIRPNGRTLVVIQLAGGNDGLNTVVPYTDSKYYEYRPNLAVPRDKVLALNSEVGFHPSLVKLKQLWDEGVVAVTEGVGYPQPNYSHFESMRIWQTASPDGQQHDGWLGRYFDLIDLSQAALPGLAVDVTTPPELYSAQVPLVSLTNVGSYQFRGDPAYPGATAARLQSLVELYSASPSKALFYSSLLESTVQTADKTVKLLQTSNQAYTPAVPYPTTPLGSGLQILAEAIAGHVGLTVGHVALGSFDTHSDQERVQSGLFATFGDAVLAFYQDLTAHGLADNVIMMTWSEFGRRVQSNASNGTDHGSAAPLFVIGKPVTGGLYGQRPDLANLDNGNLRFTTDFRSVYATILDKWLGVPSPSVLGASFDTLGFLPGNA